MKQRGMECFIVLGADGCGAWYNPVFKKFAPQPHGDSIAYNSSQAWTGSTEHDDDVICDYPQSGERILGRSNLQAFRSHHPGKPSGFKVKRILGNGNLWITEYTITYQGRLAYTVSIMEFHNGKMVRESQYFGDAFEAPAWWRQWVQQIT